MQKFLGTEYQEVDHSGSLTVITCMNDSYTYIINFLLMVYDAKS